MSEAKQLGQRRICPVCNGDGWTAEHHHECFGNCRAGLCPVQVQCAYCRAEGTVDAD